METRARRDGDRIVLNGWKRWITMTLVPTLIVMIFATAMVMLKSHIGWY